LEAILETVWRYRVVDRETVQLLHFTPGGRTAAQRVLTNLWRSRHLDKLGGRSVNERDVYFVSGRASHGLRVLSALLGEKVVRGRLKLPPRVEHALSVSRFRARLEVSARRHGLSVADWRDELDLANFAGEHLVPDAFFTVVRHDGGNRRVAGFFLEVELAAVSRRHWRSRLARYADFYYSGKYEKALGLPSLRVLAVVPHEGSQANAILDEATAAEFTPLRITTWDHVYEADRRGVLVEPIWRRPAESAPGALYFGLDQLQEVPDA
jgi:hypothetical protein